MADIGSTGFLTMLERIFHKRYDAIRTLKNDDEWLARVKDASTWPDQPPLRFHQAFTQPRQDGGYRVIAEIKRGSPSHGLFAGDHDPVAVAKAYAKNGATALSVLTEPAFFGGDTAHIEAIRKELPDIPILMKDFIFDEVQIYHARAIGADAVLLIAAHLNEYRINTLHKLAASLGLTTVVEVHEALELFSVPNADNDSVLIGVNNRNLADLSIALGRFEPIAGYVKHMPKICHLPVIAESGIKMASDLRFLAEQGAAGFLVGSSLMATADPGAALAQLLSGAEEQSS